MKFTIIINLLLFSQMIFAQSFYRGMSRTLSTTDATQSAFYFVTAGVVKQSKPDANLPFIELYEIMNEAGKVFHFLIQTDVSGKPIALGIDRDLFPFYKCENKSLVALKKCIDKKTEDPWVTNISEVYIDCILDRMNQCK